MIVDKKNLFPFLVGFGILFPMFFTLRGGVYRNPATVIDSGGIITELPLPISILTCLFALAFMLPRLREAKVALFMIFGSIAALFISLWFGNDGTTAPNRKIVMIAQVLLPMIGMLVGQLTQDRGKIVARSFLMVLSVLIPAQLFITWYQRGGVLVDYLYLFTIYSHIQFVTLILLCAFAYSLASLCDEYKLWFAALGVLMLFYVTRSNSYLTMGAYPRRSIGASSTIQRILI
jgi:hypothetical protein